jgi:Flp pilus assembly protein CpaB
MQRGRFLILIGILLAVTAAGLLLLMKRGGGEEKATETEESRAAELIPTPVPPTPVPVDRVVVAQQRIPRGTLLVTDTIGLGEWVSIEDWPQTWVTQAALTSLDQVDGRIARSDIPRGTLLTADMLTDQAGNLVSTGSDAALLIPPDRVAIAIPVDAISSVGWSLRRGDHVDVLISFLMIDLDEEFQTELPNNASTLVSAEGGAVEEGTRVLQGTYGRIEQDPFGQPLNIVPAEAQQRPRLVSQVTVRDAEVLNVGPWGELFLAPEGTTVSVAPVAEEGAAGEGTPEAGQEQTPQQQVQIFYGEEQAFTEDEVLREYLNASTHQPLLLTVSPQDALVLKWAGEAGAAMHIALRSYSDAGVRLPDTEAVTFQYMVDRFSIGLPPVLPYGYEPAVRELQRSLLSLTEPLWSRQTAPSPAAAEPQR